MRKVPYPKTISGLGKIRVRGHLNYREIVRRFERQSTFHGISHAALAPNTKWRIIWYTAFTICFCALLIQIILLIRRYRLYAKTVDLDLKFENAPFPSVTLCNLNPYKASMISNEHTTKATMDAFSRIVQGGIESYGISAAIEAARKEQSLAKKGRKLRHAEDGRWKRRYHQVYAQCICEVNPLTGKRKKGSCFAAYQGNVAIQFDDVVTRYHPSRCICQLDWTSKTLWPCFPHNTWKERVCIECSAELGHCPMKFQDEVEQNKSFAGTDICLCHKEYNHCIAENEYGYIMEIEPTADLDLIDIPTKLIVPYTTTTTTTETPEVKQALGFEGLTDEIAIKEQAKENLIFAVGEMNLTKKVEMSQQKDEFIMKCSFNQRDCDLANDFKLHYDQTYGNCYTFNWNRTKPMTAHRAGANFGLRVMLNADVAEYLPTSESIGFRVTVHDKWTVPFPDAFGYNAPTGFLSSFGVRMKKFRRIPAPHGQCRHDSETVDFLYSGFNYSVEGCHRTCTQKEVVKMCSCADPTYPTPPNTTSCRVSDPIARDCVKNATQYLSQLIAEGNLAECICPQPCSEVNYEVTCSSARWPSGTTKVLDCLPSDDLCMEQHRKNAALIQIFYEELNYETMTETPAYTLTSALADLGGLTGLWIGASVVSLLEIAALIVYTVQAYVRKKKKASMSARAAHPNFYPKYTKRSISSISSIHTEESKSSRESSKKSSLSHNSSIIQEEKSSRYLPPGAELPCDCTYSKKGKMKIMHALCPEHGYLVRRRGNGQKIFFNGSSDDSEENEDSDDSTSAETEVDDENEDEDDGRGGKNEKKPLANSRKPKCQFIFDNQILGNLHSSNV